MTEYQLQRDADRVMAQYWARQRGEQVPETPPTPPKVFEPGPQTLHALALAQRMSLLTLASDLGCADSLAVQAMARRPLGEVDE